MDDGEHTPDGPVGDGAGGDTRDGARDGAAGGTAAGVGADASAAAGVDHLQTAGREFLAAARSFLDAVESVVEDRSRLGELAESFTGFVGELVETARGGDRTPWGQAVRFDGDRSADVPEGGAGFQSAAAAGATADVPDQAATTADPQAAGVGDEAPGVPGDGAGDAPPAAPRSGRVRRIPVD